MMTTILPIRRLFCILVCSLVSMQVIAQTQVIRGRVYDKITKHGVEWATIELLDQAIPILTTSDSLGYFTIEGVPLGMRRILIKDLRYEMLVVPEIEVTAGQEPFVEVPLTPYVAAVENIVVTTNAYKTTKDIPVNEMTLSSIRSFTIEEVRRYSGARSDPARLVANFAGVNNSDDSQNDIIVRGNSPNNILWRLEGLPIPSPNYFSITGTTGGALPIMNTNLLKNSDFLSGAFPAEYGNVIGGVFDIGLRA